MTDITDLDRKRAAEAVRREQTESATAVVIAAMLARTGWEPEDPDLIAAREVAHGDPGNARYDTSTLVKAAFEGIKQGRQVVSQFEIRRVASRARRQVRTFPRGTSQIPGTAP